MHPGLHVDAVGADAGLPGVAELRGDRALDRRIEIGVVEDDEGRVAAELERELLHARRDWRHEQRPTSVEPVKVTCARRVAGQLRADLGRHAGHDVDDAGRDAGALGQLRERQRREGRLAAGLITTVQPAASAGATLRVIIAIGKFQGVMAAKRRPAASAITMRRSGVVRGDDRPVDPPRLLGEPLDEARRRRRSRRGPRRAACPARR